MPDNYDLLKEQLFTWLRDNNIDQPPHTNLAHFDDWLENTYCNYANSQARSGRAAHYLRTLEFLHEYSRTPIPFASWTLCDNCQIIIHTSRTRHAPHTNQLVCPTCYETLETDYYDEQEDDMPVYIREYSTNPLSFCGFKTHNTRKTIFTKEGGKAAYFGQARDHTNGLDTTLYYGIELEVEAFETPRSKLARDLTHTYANRTDGPIFIIKADGSLDEGIEIVTAPATYGFHTSGVWRDLFNVLNDDDAALADDTDTCGMHIHVSRAAISPLVLGRLLVFVNAASNYDFIMHMANRDVNMTRWCKTDPDTYSCGARSLKHLENGDKYTAINLRRSDTIEFRIFQGTINYTTFLENLQFVDAAIHFARDTSNRALASTDFINWLMRPSNAKYYRHLYNKIAKCYVINPVRNNKVRAA